MQKSWERGRAELFADRDPSVADPVGVDTAISWVDAIVHSAERALGAMDTEAAAGRPVGERFQAIVHLNGDQPSSASLHLGPLLSDSVRRYLLCDSTTRTVIEQNGVPLFFNEKERTVSPKLRALIEQRDRGCRVPGCGRQRWLHIHHLIHWEDGGPTLPANLCALCPAHHRLHHQGRLGIRGDPTTHNGLVFTDHNGNMIGGPKPRPPGTWALPEPRWTNPSGGRLDSQWITWNYTPKPR